MRPCGHAAMAMDVNDSVLSKWVREQREAFPGHVRLESVLG